LGPGQSRPGAGTPEAESLFSFWASNESNKICCTEKIYFLYLIVPRVMKLPITNSYSKSVQE